MFTRRRTGYRVVRALLVSTVVGELAILRASCTLYIVIRRCLKCTRLAGLRCSAIAPHKEPLLLMVVGLNRFAHRCTDDIFLCDQVAREIGFHLSLSHHQNTIAHVD